MKRKMKIKLTLALIMALVLSVFVVHMNQPRRAKDFHFAGLKSTSYMNGLSHYSLGEIQQVVKENIRGELRKGSFETVVESLKNLTFHYGGRLPYLSMVYENELWKGWLNCKVPTENVTSFTFEVRQLISEYGRVTRITISVTEVEVNQTEQSEESFSEVSIDLEEFAEGESPILSQIGTVVPWLTASLVWIVQGLIIVVPLCFVSLGVVQIFDKAIIPVWKRHFKGKRSLDKPATA